MRRLRANRTFIISGVLLMTLCLCSAVSAEGPINIELTDGNINLIAEDRQFGEVLDEMAKTISFSAKVPPELRSKRISIRMINTEPDRAVTRLFSLVQEKNYKVKFDSTGKITNLEVISGKSLKGLPNKSGKAEDRIVKQREASRSRSRRFSPRRRPSRRYQPRRVEPPEPVNEPPSPVIEAPPPVVEAQPPVVEAQPPVVEETEGE